MPIFFVAVLGKIVIPDGDGNCRYYAILEAFSFLGKVLANKNLSLVSKDTQLQEQEEWNLSIWEKLDYFVCRHDITVPPKLVQHLPEGHAHIFGLNAPNLRTKQDRIDVFMVTIGNSVYTEEFDNQDRTNMKQKWYLKATYPSALSLCIQVQH